MALYRRFKQPGDDIQHGHGGMIKDEHATDRQCVNAVLSLLHITSHHEA